MNPPDSSVLQREEVTGTSVRSCSEDSSTAGSLSKRSSLGSQAWDSARCKMHRPVEMKAFNELLFISPPNKLESQLLLAFCIPRASSLKPRTEGGESFSLMSDVLLNSTFGVFSVQSLPGPQKYVKEKPKASRSKPKGHDFRYLLGLG